MQETLDKGFQVQIRAETLSTVPDRPEIHKKPYYRGNLAACVKQSCGHVALIPHCYNRYSKQKRFNPTGESDTERVTLMANSPKILIVDDDSEIIESLTAILESRGYTITVARDGAAGLAEAEANPPDLMILDMMMPKKSGFMVLDKLRTRPEGLFPTIMMTGNEGSRHRAYAEMLGVKDYLRKPFALDRLLNAIRKNLEEAGIALPEQDNMAAPNPDEEELV